jgi:glutathione S-transferase
MKLYYMTGTCALASFISLLETGVPFEHSKVDRKTRIADDGADLNLLNPKGYVPVLKLDDGAVLTENVAVLPYIADLNPATKLAPPCGTMARHRLMEWLSYVNGEVHKNFSPLFNPAVPDAMKDIAKNNLARRLGYIEDRLDGKTYLLGEDFSVADAYLFVVLSWRDRVGVDITRFARVVAFVDRIRARPAVQAARKAEGLPPL